MQNSHGTCRRLDTSSRALSQAQNIGANLWGVDTIVTPVEGHDELAENAPNEALLSALALELQVLDDPTKVSVSTILHVQMQVLAELQMLSVVVGDNVGMAKMRQDLELGVELLALLLGHALVGDFFPAHDEAVGLAADPADDTEGAMA